MRGLEVGYRGARRVEAGKGFSGKVSLVSGRRFFDVFWVDFGVVVMGEGEVSGRVVWLEAGGCAVVEERLILRKRGWGNGQRGWVRSGFPLGLFQFERELVVAAEVGIFPRARVPGELRLSGHLQDGAPLGSSATLGGVGEWRGLREWRGGDGVKQIAWTASVRSEAGGRGLLVREDEPPGAQAEGCFLIFHSLGGEGSLIRPDRFEKALELMSGVIGVLQGYGMAVRWVADFSGWEGCEVKTVRQLAAARERLMGAERAAWTEAHDLSEVIGRARAHECVVVVSDMPLKDWAGQVVGLLHRPVLVDVCNYDGSRRKVRGGRR